ncbi:MAG: Spy/CpxP family protein refolding chaperone [Sphingomonadales bacterium]
MTMLLAVLAGSVGALGTNALLAAKVRTHEQTIHDFLHQDLELTAQQQIALDRLEEEFSRQRTRLELEMKAANTELALAMQEEHAYGPRVTAAVDHFHGAMGELQKRTLEHVFAMRAILTKSQIEQFDRSVVRALTSDRQ